jgi:ubiquitin-protein ligase
MCRACPPPPRYAHTFKVSEIRDRADFAASVVAMVREGDLKQPEWKPSSESDTKDKGAMIASLQEVECEDLQDAVAHDFEKDDDANFHIDYLTIATNLRAWNYDIMHTERAAVKVTAGRIIPALATTTAMVCGLVDIEFCKVVLGLHNLGIDQFLNSNINLATGTSNMTSFKPDAPIVQKTGGTACSISSIVCAVCYFLSYVVHVCPLSLALLLAQTAILLLLMLPQTRRFLSSGLSDGLTTFTSWDRLEYNGDMSGEELAARLLKDHGVVATSFSGETNYNPATSVPLWKAGGGDGFTLASVFLKKFASGEQESDRDSAHRKRVRGELKSFEKEPLKGVEVAAHPADDYIFHVKMNGPTGSAFEGGLFLIEIKLPPDYPNTPPLLSFVTPIEHCNILNGVPCPNLLYGAWSPATTIRAVLAQLEQLMKEPSKGAQISSLCAAPRGIAVHGFELMFIQLAHVHTVSSRSYS